MFEIKMPQMGQSVEEASIVKWFKQEGQTVTKGEPLFSIQTDKAEVECEAPESGTLVKIMLQPDVLVPVLSVIGLIGAAGEAAPDTGKAAAPAPAPAKPAPVEPPPVVAAPAAAPVAPAQPVAAPKAADERVMVSPRAKVQAAKLGVDPASLSGTGPGGRVVESDVVEQAAQCTTPKITPTAKRMVDAAGLNAAAIPGTGIGGKVTKVDVAGAMAAPAAAPQPAPIPAAAPGTVQRVPLSPMRRIIAKRMCESKFSAPHYYITVEVDMSACKALRAASKTFTPSFNDLVLAATIKALREFPAVNARWNDEYIEVVADINLGVAVALPEGLIVPVLKQAQNLSIEGINQGCKALIDKARTGKLLPDEYVGNTFTVSNLGPFGVDQFTAIINQPDSAILAVGQMKDRPVAIDGGLFIRPILKMTLSSDHRVIDGSVAAQFMGRLKAILEATDF